MARRTDLVIHVSEHRKRHYSFCYSRNEVIRHYPDLQLFATAPLARPEALANKLVVVHAGPLRPNYASAQLLSAIAMASEKVPGLSCLVIGGTAGPSDSYHGLLSNLTGLGKVVVLPYLPHQEVISLLKGCDVGISLVLPVDTTHRLACPLKLFEYLHAGLPVIGADVPDVREVLMAWDCGLTVDAQDASAIARALVILAVNHDLRMRLGRNALRAARESLNWQTQKEKLVGLFNHFTKD
jgi:glycosyltransferase involved in cell wall biosynthesis